jgi:hypothetical protein
VTTFVIGLLLAPHLSDAELLERAHAAFRQGVEARSTPATARDSFARAAADHELLRRRGFQSAALHRSQGNAYFLAGDLPRAIREYRRGLRLDPWDRELRTNLAYARGRVVYPYGGTFARLPWLPRLPPGLLATLLGGLYVLGWLGITRWLMVRRTGLLKLALAGWVAAGGFAAIWLMEEWAARQEASQRLVIIAQDGVVLRKGNGVSYPPQGDYPLNRGVEATWRFTRGDWLQIELPGGSVGWVPRADVLLDAS